MAVMTVRVVLERGQTPQAVVVTTADDLHAPTAFTHLDLDDPGARERFIAGVGDLIRAALGFDSDICREFIEATEIAQGIGTSRRD